MSDAAKPIEATKTIHLDPAIEWSGKSYDAIELREPTLDEMDAAMGQTTPMRMAKMLITKVSGLPPQVIGLLPLSKVNEASAFFEAFTPPSPKTGET